MRRFSIVLIILLGAFHIQAQELKTEASLKKQKNTILRLSLLNPSFTLEQKLAERISLSGKLGTEISISIQNIDTPNPSAQTRLIPYANLEPRYYLGIHERELEGKHTDHFSGLYLGLPFTIRLLDPGYSVGTACGFQTSFKRKAYFKASVGLGYTNIEDYSYIIRFFSDMELGFLLN